ncbi:hypothetical protein [uncultured Parvibaculum sp.]|uniref:hypothetical protein n=1 Tax=uncultured Parvibaculum sp. TaxID=291828 RepID=UPI0030DC67CA
MTRHTLPDGAPIRTIGQLAETAPRWVRISCNTPRCGNHTAVALVPLLLRWGPDAPRDWIETRFRCSKCGSRDNSIRGPSMMGSHGPEPFPLPRPDGPSSV